MKIKSKYHEFLVKELFIDTIDYIRNLKYLQVTTYRATRERRHYLYEKFERLLQERGVTAYEVAKQTGIASTTLSAWKKGEYTPKIDKLCKIANYFEIPVTYFIQ